MVPFARDLRLDFNLMLHGCRWMALLIWLQRRFPNPSRPTPARLGLWMIGTRAFLRGWSRNRADRRTKAFLENQILELDRAADSTGLSDDG